MHTQSPHYAQQAYSSYASTARESPATNTASYDAYAMPATLSSTPSEANSAVKAVDARLASRSANQKQLAPASVLPSRPAVIASHAPAPPKPPPPLPLVSVSNPALPMSLPLASSALSANVSKSSAAISNLDEDEDDEEEDDDDGGDLDKGEDDALTKRRKRNALSAARLRERRKNREFELTNSCTSLESQIARLQEELDEEKQRAKLDYISKKKPATGSSEGDVAAAVPVDSGSSTVSGLRSGTKRQWTAAQTDGEGDFTMGNAEDGGGAELTGNPKKKSRPLRELDQVRLDDLRAKIETLGQLNQQVCVNLGVLRQEIQRISNAIISQKSDRQALAVA
ncbi:hypothetical protein GGI18_001927 [Coemansia linderi]|uniref:Uncharacterized protein n=1 Tax=Coemansia linderi TaxID=2663919 RepID=A0ACC1KIY1_9FUNG|nr:hypothetical protein GGI18_001927 [Coemansia linderi]